MGFSRPTTVVRIAIDFPGAVLERGSALHAWRTIDGHMWARSLVGVISAGKVIYVCMHSWCADDGDDGLLTMRASKRGEMVG